LRTRAAAASRARARDTLESRSACSASGCSWGLGVASRAVGARAAGLAKRPEPIDEGPERSHELRVPSNRHERPRDRAARVGLEVQDAQNRPRARAPRATLRPRGRASTAKRELRQASSSRAPSELRQELPRLAGNPAFVLAAIFLGG